MRTCGIVWSTVICLLFSACQQKETRTDAAQHPLLDHLRTEVNQGHMLICAHRGFHNDTIPENSLASIRAAVTAGIDMVEIDIRTTSDDSLMLMHDDTVDRTTNGTGRFSDLTFQEVKQLRLTIGDSITDHRVPTLREALLAFSAPTYPNLDIKDVDFDDLLRQLRSLGMEHQVLSYLWNPDHVASLTAKEPRYAVLPMADTLPKIDFFAKATASPLIHFNEHTYTEEGMDIARNNEQLVFMNILWAEDTSLVAGNTAPLDQFIQLQPAIIQTDYPGLLLAYLRKKGLHD